MARTLPLETWKYAAFIGLFSIWTSDASTRGRGGHREMCFKTGEQVTDSSRPGGRVR